MLVGRRASVVSLVGDGRLSRRSPQEPGPPRLWSASSMGVQLSGDHAAPQAWQGRRIPNRTPAGVPAAPSQNLFQRPALSF